MLLSNPLLFLVASPKGLKVTTTHPQSIDYYPLMEQWWLTKDAKSKSLKDLPPEEKRHPFGWCLDVDKVTESTVLGVFYADDSGSMKTLKGMLRLLSKDLGLPIARCPSKLGHLHIKKLR